MKKSFKISVLILLGIILISGSGVYSQKSFYKSSKPYTRWWWFASVIKKEDIKYQLNWLKSNNFGGVEIAWMYPYKHDTTVVKLKWLSPEWSEVVQYAKNYADSIGLGCDFTFGTGWPFGDSFVKKEDATQQFGAQNDDYKKAWSFWEHPHNGYILNHLDSNALYRYSEKMGGALTNALKGEKSGLFCDSWEVPSSNIWTTGFDSVFLERYNYDIKNYMNFLNMPALGEIRYDYYKLVSEYILHQFYMPFTNIAHQLQAFSRVQCMGAPLDVISAYANIDVPETEAMLYNPSYARIVASSAALASKKDISSETFTCIYSFPNKHHSEEQTADLKLVADALFANGVNQIYWHGMPYNSIGCDSIKFFASVHVGSKGSLAEELPAFNLYMEKVSKIMKQGLTYSDVAVYIPLEDAWIAGSYPKEKQKPGSGWYYDLQYVKTADELIGYQPLWINTDFLKKAILKDKLLNCGDIVFSSLYIDVEYLDFEALQRILELAKEDFPVCIKRQPKQPGLIKSKNYKEMYKQLVALENVSENFEKINKNKPLIQGDNLPEYWCKKQNDDYYIFFAHPLSKNLNYPIKYGQSYSKENQKVNVKVNIEGKAKDIKLVFKPYQSILLKINEKGKYEFIDIAFKPKVPKIEEEADAK